MGSSSLRDTAVDAIFDPRRRIQSAKKDDFTSDVTIAHECGRSRVVLEPMFVALKSDASDIIILAANEFAAAPLATIELSVRAPFGFHGNWEADSL